MPSPDIDSLYQLPFGEFTSARNELAKKSGKAGADIKALEKPSVPAWGVNQLYWRERRTYEKLIRASERVRLPRDASCQSYRVTLDHAKW